MAREFFTEIDLHGNRLVDAVLTLEDTSSTIAPSPGPGRIIFDGGVVKYHDGTDWITLGAGGGSGASASSWPYKWRTVTTATDPGHGYVKADSANATLYENIYISVYDQNGQVFLAVNELHTGSEFHLYEGGQIGTWNKYRLVGPPVQQGSPVEWVTLPVMFVESGPDPFAPGVNTEIVLVLDAGSGGGGGGTVILHGTGTPTADVGQIGNYYLDTDDHILYGPKDVGTAGWGSDQSGYTTETPAGGMNMGSDQVWGQDVTFASAGRITGLRHYRPTGTTVSQTTKTLRLWHADGSQLAVASTSGESGSGWKTATLSTPVTVVAGQTVRVSQDIVGVTSPSVAYSAAEAPLPSNGDVSLGQAYYTGVVGTRPTTNQTGNWFVDVVFQGSTIIGTWPLALKSIPVGGTPGQVLSKVSATDFDAGWTTPVAGGPTAPTRYTHTQAVLASTWTITHNLGAHPAVSVEDAVGTVLYGTITYLNDNALTVSFNRTATGRANLI